MSVTRCDYHEAARRYRENPFAKVSDLDWCECNRAAIDVGGDVVSDEADCEYCREERERGDVTATPDAPFLYFNPTTKTDRNGAVLMRATAQVFQAALQRDIASGDIIVDDTRGLGPRWMPYGLAHEVDK